MSPKERETFRKAMEILSNKATAIQKEKEAAKVASDQKSQVSEKSGK